MKHTLWTVTYVIKEGKHVSSATFSAKAMALNKFDSWVENAKESTNSSVEIKIWRLDLDVLTGEIDSDLWNMWKSPIFKKAIDAKTLQLNVKVPV